MVVRAPGRVNLIGDHTDYNDGFVLPMAIDADVVIASRRRRDRAVFAVSETQPEPASFDLATVSPGAGWGEYLKGVAVALGTDGLSGWEGVVTTDLAEGAGLSSSAAIELATARVFAEFSELEWDPTAMAGIAQRAENDWVGMNSGIMDQLICATAQADHARLIDCRDLTGTHVPIPNGAAVVLLDTTTRRQLVESAYNDRRASCETAARKLGVDSLRDATVEMVEEGGLPEVLLARARHVVAENARTEGAAVAFHDGALERFGRLMNDSHASLRDDFDVSSPALDAMATAAQRAPGCYGARQTGGGFAGSCVALVAEESMTEFQRHTLVEYEQRTGMEGTALVCRAVDGAELVAAAEDGKSSQEGSA